MQFSAIVVVVLAAMPFAAADVHSHIICTNYKSSVLDAGTSTAGTNDAATIAACKAYRARNTGTKQWDTCPDCHVIQHNPIKACESLGSHIGGDEFNYYCKQNGATDSAAY